MLACDLRQPCQLTGVCPIPRFVQTIVLAATASLSLAGPAHAATVTLPDPSGLTLFTLGVAGLILGRRAAGRKKGDDEE
jgi:hypothetical protein